MNRTILHSDCNCFYVSVELLHHPELRGKPVAVGGDPEARHGIVLTADYTAKRYGVKTGMALWQAKQVCPDITFLPPRMDLYLRFSRMAQEIYADYTDKREPYGIDESWLDVTDSATLKGDGFHIAQEISSRMKKELGITVSVGVSFNKIFAKLGSDYKKPDAITTMYEDEFQRNLLLRFLHKILRCCPLHPKRSSCSTLPSFSALAALPPMQNSQHTVLTIRLYILYHCSTVDFYVKSRKVMRNLSK